jgi:tetratricopeptide (TPR) repeat protein
MTRDNLLFAIIGLLLGFIIGFMFHGTMSQRGPAAPVTTVGQNLPANHPQTQPTPDPRQVFAEVQASISQAKNEPKNFEAQLKAAELYYQIQRYDSAIEFLIKANQLRPDDYSTLVALALVNLDAEHYDASQKWYRVALSKKPDDVKVLAGLCAAALGKGDAKAAQQAIAKLEKVDPNAEDLPQFREKLNSLKSPAKGQ